MKTNKKNHCKHNWKFLTQHKALGSSGVDYTETLSCKCGALVSKTFKAYDKSIHWSFAKEKGI